MVLDRVHDWTPTPRVVPVYLEPKPKMAESLRTIVYLNVYVQHYVWGLTYPGLRQGNDTYQGRRRWLWS